MRPYPEAPGYFVNENGEVFSSYPHLRKMPTRYDRHGYETAQVRVGGKTKTRFVHRMVMWAYAGPSNLQVNHKDYNPKNNSLENLEYCSATENIRHAYLRRPKKEKPSKVERPDDREFIELILAFKGELTAREVADLFGLSKSFVDRVWQGLARPWQHARHKRLDYRRRKRREVREQINANRNISQGA